MNYLNHPYHIRIFLFILGIQMVGISYAQNLRLYNLEIGIEHNSVQDFGHSPLQYSGNNTYLGLSTQKLRNDFRTEAKVNYAKSKLTPNGNIKNTFGLFNAQRTMLTGSYSVQKNIYEKGEIHIFMGGATNILYDFINFNNNANNPVGYELSLSINPKSTFVYRHSEKIQLRFEADIPIIAYTVRPDILGLFPTENMDINMGQIIIGGRISSINKFFNIHTKTALDFQTNSGRKFNFFYEYLGGFNHVQENKNMDQHRIGFSYCINQKTLKNEN